MTPARSPRVRLRAAVLADARPLARVLTANRAFLAPFEPLRHDDYFTAPGQAARIEARLVDEAVGRGLFRVIEADGEIAGTISVSMVSGWPFRSASTGYWVAEELNGRGIATAAIAAVVEEATDVLGVRRLEAGTLVDNVGSQRALLRNGFLPFGVAPRYLEIAGAFRDHILFQRLADAPPAAPAAPAGLALAERATPRGPVLEATVDGRRAGRARLTRRRDGALRLEVHVPRGLRRRGIGAALVRGALELAARQGAVRVEATVQLADAATLALLLRCGFATEGVVEAGEATGAALLARAPGVAAA